MRLRSFAALALILLASACASAPASSPAPWALAPVTEPEAIGDAPGIDEAVVAVGRDLLGSTRYDLPVEANSWVEAEVDFLVGERAHVIARWLERGDVYEPFVKGVLAAHGLPTDLFHLAMIESAFIPTARSRAGAVGMWQFMPATGRMEGLRVDSLVDERMDPVRSTYAAARHLQRLHRSFGDWHLAAAAYNAGSGRISRGLRNFAVDNFWDLAQVGDLAAETRHYVPRLNAMTIIARDRTRFGFPAAGRIVPFAVDTVNVDLATPLLELARLGAMDAPELARLNPHLLRGITPEGDYAVWSPRGTGPALQQAYLESEFRAGGGVATYAVRSGESLGSLAAASTVREERIRELNPAVEWERLRPGTPLTLPRDAARALAARPVPRPVAAAPRPAPPAAAAAPRAASAATPAPSGPGGTHAVQPGESLWSIARGAGVSIEALRAANQLTGDVIRPGQLLVIPGSAPAAREHVVREGESLWGIAREYSVSVEALRLANELRGDVIRPGQKLVIPAAE
jgi:membrane-bound lytic murein transglycosylase D